MQLMMHLFEPPGHQPTDRRPAALFFFGGGWTGGTVQQFALHCRSDFFNGLLGPPLRSECVAGTFHPRLTAQLLLDAVE